MSDASTQDIAARSACLSFALPLSIVVYRSRARQQVSLADLRDLIEAAQDHNAREQITGLLLYDDGWFYQWLEGPRENVARLMFRISQDARHKDLEVLDRSTSLVRSFAGWSMKLATANALPFALLPDEIDPPAEILRALQSRPREAPMLLLRLVSMGGHGADGLRLDVPRRPATALVLASVFQTEVLPQLVRARERLVGQDAADIDTRCRDLAESLVSGDAEAALGWLATILEAGRSLGQLAASLLEPVARRLGDLWADDLCSEFDVTLGLCRLQTLVRLLSAQCPAHLRSAVKPRILIAPEPGELHRLGAALDQIVLEAAGWAPVCAYPADDMALDSMLSDNWFDVLDLSLSLAFRREQDLPRLAETIAQARRASCNKALVVIVGGRVFAEQSGAAERVGADVAHATARTLNCTILRTLSAKAAKSGAIGTQTPSPRAA